MRGVKYRVVVVARYIIRDKTKWINKKLTEESQVIVRGEDSPRWENKCSQLRVIHLVIMDRVSCTSHLSTIYLIIYFIVSTLTVRSRESRVGSRKSGSKTDETWMGAGIWTTRIREKRKFLKFSNHTSYVCLFTYLVCKCQFTK